MTTFARVAVAAAAVLLFAATTAAGRPSDPRKCSAVTPGGATKHAYWCAHYAAVAAVRARMAVVQKQPRWYYPTFCDEAGGLLRWRCVTTGGGQTWKAAVTFRATKAGWKTAVTVTQP